MTHQIVAVIMNKVVPLRQEVTEMLIDPTPNQGSPVKVPNHRGLEDAMDEDGRGELGLFCFKMRA